LEEMLSNPDLITMTKLDLKEKLLTLLLEKPLLPELMDTGFPYKTGLLVPLLVEEELELYTKNVSPLLKEEKTVSENLL